jgi:hypothetical protein
MIFPALFLTDDSSTRFRLSALLILSSRSVVWQVAVREKNNKPASKDIFMKPGAKDTIVNMQKI